MLEITEINRNEHGVIVNIGLNDGRRVTLHELYKIVEEQNVGGAFISHGQDGSKEFHLVNDGDYGDKLESLTLF